MEKPASLALLHLPSSLKHIVHFVFKTHPYKHTYSFFVVLRDPINRIAGAHTLELLLSHHIKGKNISSQGLWVCWVLGCFSQLGSYDPHKKVFLPKSPITTHKPAGIKNYSVYVFALHYNKNLPGFTTATIALR